MVVLGVEGEVGGKAVVVEIVVLVVWGSCDGWWINK